MKILVVDDHKAFRGAFICFLKKFITPTPTCVEAENGLVALKKISETNFSVIFLDVSMPVMDGYEACKQIARIARNIPIILLTQFDDQAIISHFLNIGARAFLTKDSSQNEIKTALTKAISGETYFPQIVKAKTNVHQSAKLFGILHMSEQEKKLIKLLSLGYSSKEISAKMELTHKTVRTYRERLLRKTNARNVAELVAFGFKTGLII